MVALHTNFHKSGQTFRSFFLKNIVKYDQTMLFTLIKLIVKGKKLAELTGFLLLKSGNKI